MDYDVHQKSRVQLKTFSHQLCWNAELNNTWTEVILQSQHCFIKKQSRRPRFMYRSPHPMANIELCAKKPLAIYPTANTSDRQAPL
jgi:hypothetical protein